MYMYVCIRMHMRESITISRKGEHNSYRRIDWRRLGARSVVMVGNGMSECQELRSDRFSRARRNTASLRTWFTAAI